jgi:hypothetical protein
MENPNSNDMAARGSRLPTPICSAGGVANKLAEGLAPSWKEAAALLHDFQKVSDESKSYREELERLLEVVSEEDHASITAILPQNAKDSQEDDSNR